MNGISTWAAAAGNTFAEEELEYIYTTKYQDFSFGVYATGYSFWLLAQWAGGGEAAFRMAYSPEGGHIEFELPGNSAVMIKLCHEN